MKEGKWYWILVVVGSVMMGILLGSLTLSLVYLGIVPAPKIFLAYIGVFCAFLALVALAAVWKRSR